MILRKQQPNRHRPFRTPMVWVVCPLAVAGCLLLFFNLSLYTISLFFGWAIIGLIVYRLYGYGHSDLGRGIAAEKRGDAPPPEPVFHEGPEA
jgi:APA family basic amino acid/polyamine antiporter